VTIRPAVSVLVTVHNREAFLGPCLDSILRSTFEDFEVVVVDDRSSDGSAAIAREAASRDSRIRFIQNEQNLGDYPNRMRAAEESRGHYIKYVDSDDLIYPHSLAIMVEAMKSNPATALGLSHSLPEDDEPYPWQLAPRDSWRKHFLGDGCFGCGPSGAIMSRERFFEAGGFRSWGVLSDTDLWYRMSARWPVVLLAPGLVWWRRHEMQEFTRDGAKEKYLESGYKLDVHALESKENPLTADETRAAFDRVRQHHARRLLALSLRSRRPLDGWRMFRQSGLGAMDVVEGFKPYR
jgi:glycosyltransferase involved in cell wall biosynthesis